MYMCVYIYICMCVYVYIYIHNMRTYTLHGKVGLKSFRCGLSPNVHMIGRLLHKKVILCIFFGDSKTW